MLPAQQGSYLLWFYLPRRTAISIGRRGRHSFARGWYGYCGSACGAGGVRGRLAHHLRPAVRCHWHIDYFKPHASLRQVWVCTGANREHDFSRILLSDPLARCPLPGFGASDCDCDSHFVYLPRFSRVQLMFRRIVKEAPLRRWRWHPSLSGTPALKPLRDPR